MNKIEGASEGFLKDRGSKFIAYAYPVKTVEEAQEKVHALKKQYFDARHHCYAYRLGEAGETEYMTDDGEPSHTAGSPILGQIRAHDLTNSLVVVIRYFGGTKLGVRGLIEAYKGAALAAIEANELIPIVPQVIFRIQYEYSQTSEINRLLHNLPIQQIEATYLASCSQTFAVEEDLYPRIEQQFEGTIFKLEELERRSGL